MLSVFNKIKTDPKMESVCKIFDLLFTEKLSVIFSLV
jgi:hypothetical protein